MMSHKFVIFLTPLPPQSPIFVTSFSSIPYCSNSEYWTQKHTQSENIHSITLDVHVLEAERLLNTRIKLFNSSTVISFGRTREVEAQFQIEASDPYPPNKQRTDLGTLVVLSSSSSVTFLPYALRTCVTKKLTFSPPLCMTSFMKVPHITCKSQNIK